MARKKITIDAVLEQISDAWCGVNETGSEQTIYGTPVPAGREWGVKKEHIEALLRQVLTEHSERLEDIDKRVGCFKIIPSQTGTEVLVGGFATEASYETWRNLESDSDKWGEVGQAYLLTTFVLPSMNVDTYTVTLQLEAVPTEIQATNDVTVGLKGLSSVAYGSGGGESIGEDLTIEVQTRTSPTGQWVQKGVRVIGSNQENYVGVSLKDFLQTGTNYVRLRAVGEYASSVWRSFTITVVNLSLVQNTALQIAQSGDTLSLNYLVGGNIGKTIQFEFGTGLDADFVADFSYQGNDPGCSRALGSATNMSTGMTFDFDDAQMIAILLSDGVHTVRARLYVSETVKTDWIESQYIAASDGTVKFVALNNVMRQLDNWSDAKLFDYAVYCGGESSATVCFRFTNSADTVEYARWTNVAEDGRLYSLQVQLGVEVEGNPQTIYGCIHIEDGEGQTLAPPVYISLSNSAANQPTRGADFILQPSGRSNSEPNPARIVNAADGSLVTASFTGFGWISDGWMEVFRDVDSISDLAEKLRALHVPANRRIEIDYNPFTQFTDGNNAGRSMTLEIDFRTSNVLDENQPILRIGSDGSDGKVWGFEMLPLEAYLLTQRMRVVDDQNVSWAEGVRTRLTVNIVYGLRGQNLVRIMIDGGIEREFKYTSSDRFTESGVKLVIGNTSSDIDIFGIRCYKKALSVSEVEQDYKASLSTASEKISFATANDILGDGGDISWQKCLGKYNVIGHTGHLPKYGDANKGKTSGVSLYIGIAGDAAHSGTLTALDGSGQGTTAMTYYDWNQQYKITEESVFTADNGTAGEAGGGYAIQAGEALAKKLVGKINFASGMQSHKLGLTWIYNDLYKQLVKNSVITKPSQMELYPNARLAVLEKPFLFFHRETENDPWDFRYLMTFGAGKGDKPTFGFNKNTTPNMLMLEGANNDRPLALFRIPWNDDITYSPDDEAYMYNGQKQLNFGLGTTVKVDGREYPSSTAAIAAHQAFFNFAYLHHSRPTYFDGTLTQLQRSESADHTRLYWVTEADAELGSEQYDLYRWDELTGQWVDGGIGKLGTGSYEKLNMRTQYETFCAETGVSAAGWTAGRWSSINDMIIAMRRSHFKAMASNYMHIDDGLYHSCFVKLYGGTDNRAKNTYYYTDPVTLKIRFWQDDVDTMLKTNNVGQQRKPYYVEEHDTNAAGDYYWQGEESGFFNVLEEAFESEMTTMMYNMLSAMAQIGGSVMGFHEQYYFSTQDYFPVTAYNEQARLVYENAALAQAEGVYKNDSVQAISQSCGRQRWSEYQWLRDRIMYISSWCEYGEFAGSSEAPNGMSWRGKSGSTYNFVLTPAKWLYPRVGSDSGNYPASAGGGRVRVAAGTSLNYPAITLSSDSWISVRGIDYMLDLGDMNIGLSSEQGTFSFSGKRLQRVRVNPTGQDTNQFLASRIEISNAVNIKEFTVRGVTTASGDVDLRKCARLETVDLRGSTFNMAELGDNTSLRRLQIPSTFTLLHLDGVSGLELLESEGTENLSEVSITGGSGVWGYTLLDQCRRENAPLSVLVLSGETWRDPGLNTVRYVTDVVNRDDNDACSIAMALEFVNINLTFAMKQELLAAFGNIDDVNNAVRASYTRHEITNITLSGSTYMPVVGRNYQIEAVASPSNGNNFKQVVWSLDSNNNATVSQTGVVTVSAVSSEAEGAQATVTCSVTLDDDTVVTGTKVLRFHPKTLRVGDYVFSDGSYDADINGGGGLTPIGRCFYINPADPTDRRMYSLSQLSSSEPWGLSGNITLADESSYGQDVPLLANNNGATITDRPGGKPQGKYNTELIISHRNKILKDGNVNLPVPEEQFAADGSQSTEWYLLQDMAQAAARSGSLVNYYYPAASRCHAYEPSVRSGEQLAEQFKAGSWYLPIDKELQKMRQVDASVIGTTYWTSQENSNTGYASGVNSSGASSHFSKTTGYAVRAAAAF